MQWSLLSSHRGATGRNRTAAPPVTCSRARAHRWALAVLVVSMLLLLIGPAAGAQAAGTASLTGTVSAIKGGNLNGIEVTANGFNGFGTTTTAAGGKYTIAGLGEGSYTVGFSDPSGKYVFLERSATLSEGAATELNAALQETGSISGTVTSAASGAGLGNVSVSISGPVSEFTTTEANGHYTIGELPPGNYSIEFFAGGGFVAQTAFTTVTEGAVSQVNAALKQGGKISGRVTDAYTHNGLGKIGVNAFNPNGVGGGFAVTNDNGEYTVSGLPSGSYKISYFWLPSEAEFKEFEHAPRFIPKYIEQFFSGQPSAATANTVAASEGNVTSGIDVAMVPSAPVNKALPVISGAAAAGSPLACSSGSWTGETLSLNVGWPLTTPFGYQWLRNGTAITGSTSPTYVVAPADLGHGLECEVTASIEAGHASAKSALFPVASPVPVVTISASKLRASKNSTKVSVKCANATCAGAAQLVLTVFVKHRKGKRNISKKSTLVLAKGTYSVAAGKTGTITLRLTKGGRSRLAGAHRLTPKLVVSVAGGKGHEDGAADPRRSQEDQEVVMRS